MRCPCIRRWSCARACGCCAWGIGSACIAVTGMCGCWCVSIGGWRVRGLVGKSKLPLDITAPGRYVSSMATTPMDIQIQIVKFLDDTEDTAALERIVAFAA